jgi:cytochrome c1
LDQVSEQVYVAGVLANTPENLAFWIANPKAADPRTAMPDLGVSETEARDMAAFLYGLK